MSSFVNVPELRQSVAGSSPADLLKQPSFWRRQRTFLVIICFSAVTFYLLAPYTYESSEGWGMLTIAVQVLALWGAVISARALAKLDVEMAIVCEIEVRGTEYLREIKGGLRTRVDLDSLEQTIVPDNPSDPPLGMIRLFQHICKEAKDRRFESSVAVVQSYREEPLEDIFRLQNLQKIALWLGILGTFIGLLIAIRSGDLNKVEGGEAFLAIIRQMFDGLFISFSASLAGLEVAVILGFFLLLLRKRQEVYFKNMESAAVTMLSLARNSINKDDFLAEFSQITTTVGELSDRVFEQTKDLSERIVGIHKQIKDQTDQIRTGIGKLSTANAQFDGFLKQISESQDQFIGDVKGIYDVISLKNLGATLNASIGVAGKQIADTLGSNVNQMAGQLARFNGSVTALSSTLQNQAGEAAKSMKSIESHIKTSTAEHAKAVQSIVSQLQEGLSREAAVSQSLKRELQELTRKIGDLNDGIDRAGSFVRPRRRSFWEFISSLRS